MACIGVAATLVAEGNPARPAVSPCPARATAIGGVPLTWHQGRPEDTDLLAQWCRGVGAPILQTSPGPGSLVPPPLEELVVLTWNAHLAEGRLADVIGGLRAGAFTSGRPVRHFVLLVQELYRRGPAVPRFPDRARTAFAIVPRDPNAPDAADHAASLGLSLFYVPSMRNGAHVLEDRGNAILSTEPLIDLLALELPLERQRRVAIGAAVQVTIARRVARLELINAHLEPLSSPKSLWIFRNPRRPQARAILTLLKTPRFDTASVSIGTVLGGDLNVVLGGVKEDAYVQLRAWSRSLMAEDQRPTHLMGRIDHLFFRLADGWGARTRRLDNSFGSDHYPVLGSFAPISSPP